MNLKPWLIGLFVLLTVTNVLWFGTCRNLERLYDKLDADYMQECGLRDEADSLLRAYPDNAVYSITRTANGEAEVYCLNGADATIRPSTEFGHITVSCGK